MNRFLSHISLPVQLLLALMMSVTMYSCASEDNAPDTRADESGNFEIKFQIATMTNPGSRAADISGEQEGSGAENWLDIYTLTYYIYDSEQNFISNITPDTKAIAVNETFTLYEVTAKLGDKYFSENINNTLDFYILVLANYKNIAWNTTLTEPAIGDNISNLFQNGVVMAPTKIPEASRLMSPADYATGEHFPMVGLQRFTFHGSMLTSAYETMPYDISLATGKYVNMLRGLTKIEIIDRINIPDDREYDDALDGNSPLRISDAVINGFMNQGTLLPAMAQWTRNLTFETQQVEAPTIPGSAIYQPPVAYNTDNTINDNPTASQLKFSIDYAATASRKDKCHVYSCYLFEYSRPNNVAEDLLPYILIKTKGSTTTPVVEPIVLPMRLAEYENGTIKPNSYLQALLRNHIYRYEITGIGQQIQVNWTVCRMDEASTTIEFN